ncbi:Glycoside hydrolase, family 17 [Corchorus olitorius]|uniref:glucan endo-1,3-beta-D-glucosidase n=1 Tax=Corchorus olitorius TaxID=93759 RepID=A0A1R3IV64_9ROSI|nr:Glycoside hydrolase, family 17 [Corchorus olitorius]
MGQTHKIHLLWFFFIICLFGYDQGLAKGAFGGLACNWGLQSTHPLPPSIVVKLLKDNGFTKVKLFEADPGALKALGRSGIQVMVGIPNDMLAGLASSVRNAEAWVQQNVSNYISRYGTDIRLVAVANEPFLHTYKDMFVQTTFPALQNIQAAIIKAGLGKQVKVTIPLNADVYQTDTGLPSGGDFRPDIKNLMVNIVKFLQDNGDPLTINIYPFLSLQADPNFPKEYAFFNNTANPLVDGSIVYTNVYDANFDTLISTLEKNGFGQIPVIVGEVGWPTDGDPNANIDNARRFNQALLNRIVQGIGSPKRRTPPDVYLFSLVDEDNKSVEPGNFERHWGIFNFDGSIKYPLDMGNGRPIVAARGVKYLAKQWCVMAPSATVLDPNVLAQSISYACQYADCTSLGYGSSCSNLDARANASYAFNMYYQTMNQRKDSCVFNNLSTVTTMDPSQGTCRFEIMIDIGKHELAPSSNKSSASRIQSLIMALVLGLVVVICGVH